MPATWRSRQVTMWTGGKAKGAPKVRFTEDQLAERTPWRRQAACVGSDPDLWFDDPDYAKTVCQGCPVRARCLETALAADERFGVFGGLTVEERDALVRRHVRAA